MPSVYTFTHSHNDILNALVEVFSIGRGTMREQWTTQAEILVEPVGWDALWKLSKRFCKKFEARFPCIALITVTSVDYEELTADVDVLSVQHESVSLPERVTDVPFIELWPTVKQREEFVNAEGTAEFIDLMRFYYENLWMPWDDQDNKVILSKTVEDRMSLWLELHNGSIPNSVARSIIMLRNSAINAHEKLRELDSSLCEGGMADEDDSLLPSNYISQCAEMNANLDSLIPKWSLYEDPLVREHYLALARTKWQENKSKRNVVALWQGGSMKEFTNISNFLKSKVSNEQNLMIMVSAEEGLSLEPEEVIVCSSNYEVPEMPLLRISLCSFNGATLKATEMRSCLLMMSEECKIQDLILNCARVNTIIVMRAGSLHVKNCKFSDDSENCQSDFAQGIVAMSEAKIIVEDCTFENFYSGLVVHEGAQVELRNCAIKRCGVGIQMYSGSHVKLDGTVISSCTEQSIRCELSANVDYKGAGMDGLEVASNCKIGAGNLQQEVLVVKQDSDML
ncbi:protein nessun dorma [Pararge aegeria]|uniref:Jg13717 protein n=2 Tax=Pararge aegeria TaxID=116150 RepID=A0A8S4RQS0_9NEOP|nr:protein nessun dorma [Pararge aegeria]CAH2238909.1 jg13717 [Pararge aegeria aegeria]